MAAEATFYVEIVTPDRMRFEGDATLLVLPGAVGQMGVLANHMPLLALLEPGMTRVRAQGHDQVFATGEGFVKINQNKASVLVEFADKPEEIDRSLASRQAEEAQAAMAGTMPAAERQSRTNAWKAAQARLKVQEAHRP